MEKIQDRQVRRRRFARNSGPDTWDSRDYPSTVPTPERFQHSQDPLPNKPSGVGSSRKMLRQTRDPGQAPKAAVSQSVNVSPQSKAGANQEQQDGLRLKLDLHVHTTRSRDALTALDHLPRLAKNSGLDGAALTNYDCACVALSGGPAELPLKEIFSSEGHVIG